MLERIRGLFTSDSAPRPPGATGAAWDRNLAAAALLVEAAMLDGHFADKEREAIHSVLSRHFGLTTAEAKELIDVAEKAQAEANHLVRFTRTLKDAYGPDERAGILEMLWEVEIGRAHV